MKIARVLLVFVSLTLGCTDFSPYAKQGSDLVGTFSPQVDDLLKSNESLASRAKKLAPTLGGATELVGKLAENQTQLQGLKSAIGSYPSKIDEAIKGGSVDAVTSLLATQKADATTGIATATEKLTVLSNDVKAKEAEQAAQAAAAAAKAAEPTTFSKSLASGFSLSGNLTGIESQLVAFIEDSTKQVDKTTWFNFDRLAFKTGSAELDLEQSKEQLVNVAEILKAYPKVTLKVGGYTDNQGNAAANKKLSAQRASNVAAAIGSFGIKANRLSPEGYGSTFPVCAANDTEACRAQNRRIALRVTAK